MIHNQYNINQTTLNISLEYIPEKNHPALYINELVESLELKYDYQFGRPREYDLGAMLKLTLLAYSYGIFSSRKIERFARENKPAGWLIADQVPSYRTICRFRISDELATLTQESLTKLTAFLKKHNLIDDISFIDGTKILADANKYSFVWKKNVVRFGELNRQKVVELLGELHEAKVIGKIPKGSNLTLETLDVIIAKFEDYLVVLDQKVEETKKVSPNPAKQERRKLKATYKKLLTRKEKMQNHQKQKDILGERNSYSKTDHDATFMRVKEDPMLNGQLKPAYNLQIATSNQFITGYKLFANPTDTRTLPIFIDHLNNNGVLGSTIVADAGYGSESNYRFCADNYGDRTVLIPYGTMLKENSRKWKTDDHKIMNWSYNEKDDYYLDLNGVRFNFSNYSKRTDKYGFTRDFKVYTAEKFDDDHLINPRALTKSGHVRKIMVNNDWEYFKAQQRTLLSSSDTRSIYARRKIDVEPVFGRLKASLGFNRFSVRGSGRVEKEMGIVVLAMNINKLVTVVTKINKIHKEKVSQKSNFRFLRYFSLIETTYVTASSLSVFKNTAVIS